MRRVRYKGDTAILAGPAAPRPHGAPGQRPSRLAPTDGRFIDGHQIDFLAELRNPYSGAIRYQPPKTLVNSPLNTGVRRKDIPSATTKYGNFHFNPDVCRSPGPSKIS